MEKLQEIYCQYTEASKKATKAASPLAGIFGTGGGVKDHHCHTDFYERVGQWVDAFLSQQPGEAAAAEAARFILVAGATHKGQPAYWHCFAAQGHAMKLIELLSQEDCATLRQEYDSLYPASVRLPVNQQVYDLLCTRCGYVPPKKGLFRFLGK